MALPQRPQRQAQPNTQTGEQFSGYQSQEEPPPEAYYEEVYDADPFYGEQPQNDYIQTPQVSAPQPQPVEQPQVVEQPQQAYAQQQPAEQPQNYQQQQTYAQQQPAFQPTQPQQAVRQPENLGHPNAEYQAAFQPPQQSAYQPPPQQQAQTEQSSRNSDSGGSGKYKVTGVDSFYDYELNDQTMTQWWKFTNSGEILKGCIVDMEIVEGGNRPPTDGRTHYLRYTVRTDNGRKFFIANQSSTFKAFFSELQPQKGDHFWMECIVCQKQGSVGEYKGYIFDPETGATLRATRHYGHALPTPVNVSDYQNQPQAPAYQQHQVNAVQQQPQPQANVQQQPQQVSNGYAPQSYTPPATQQQ